MAIDMQEGNLPHIFWIDLKQDGVYVECAVMKKDGFGNISYIPLKALDSIDKKRMARIVRNRNAQHFALWDLMSNITLNNGVNALEYFHQLVHVITPSGRVMRPGLGEVGVGEGQGEVDTRGAQARATMEQNAATAADAAAQAAAAAAVAAIQQLNQPQAGQPQQLNEAPVAEEAAAPAPAPKKRATRKKAAT